VRLPPRNEHPLMRIQDQMVVNIVDATKWTRPVYMALTVSDDNLMGLTPFLLMQGLVCRVMPHTVAEKGRTDIERSLYLFDHVYRFPVLGNGSAPFNETSKRVLSNYSASFLQIALALRKSLVDIHEKIIGFEKAAAPRSNPSATLTEERKRYSDTLAVTLRTLNRCISIVPWDWRARQVLHEVLLLDNRFAEAEFRMREAFRMEPGNTRYMRMLAQVLDMEGKKQEAEELMKALMRGNGGDLWETYAAAAQDYAGAGAFDSALVLLREYAVARPGDPRAAKAIEEIELIKKKRYISGHAAAAR
jgi:hypothetical protein